MAWSGEEFLYNEDQRLALERLLGEGEHSFHNFITTNRVQPFLSDLELAQFISSVESYCPASPDHMDDDNEDNDGTHLSLQYWPERSCSTLPELDLGWPRHTFYRGVTRVSVHAQPPLPGHSHIKEIVRKMIAHARKVIAVVMDLFTDVDIFKDLLDASFKRKVTVYIILEASGVPHFLHMCKRTAMHTGHLKNLRVRSIKGHEFFTRSSKKVCGSLSQKFMFVDGDKAVSGSYSFTWSASRLDRSISTVLTGQVVEFFDFLFQELYLMSNAVNLNNLKLENKPFEVVQPILKSSPSLPSDIILRLNNPKYALVCGNGTVRGNCLPSDKCTTKTDCTEQMKKALDVQHGHPGLLHLEKVNIFNYLPVWPKPDSPSNVMELNNFKDYKKPLQAQFQFNDSVELKEAPTKSRLKSSSHLDASPIKQLYIQPLAGKEQSLSSNSSKEKDALLFSFANPKTPHNSDTEMHGSAVNHGEEGLINLTEQRKYIHKRNTNSVTNTTTPYNTSIEQSGVSQQVNHGMFCSTETNSVTTNNLSAHTTTSVNRSYERTLQTYNELRHDDRCQKCKDLEPDRIDCHLAETSSSKSVSSEGYFEFIDSLMADDGRDGMATKIPLGFKLFAMDLPQNIDAHSLISLTSEFHDKDLETYSCEYTPGHQSIGTPQLQIMYESLPEMVSSKNLQETQDIQVRFQQGSETKPLYNPCIQDADGITAEIYNKKYDLLMDSVINNSHLYSVGGRGTNNSKHSLLMQSKAAPLVPVLKVAEDQCIVFSDTVNGVPFWKLKPDPYTSYN